MTSAATKARSAAGSTAKLRPGDAKKPSRPTRRKSKQRPPRPVRNEFSLTVKPEMPLDMCVDLGGEVNYPRRIVCLTDETTETLYMLGEQERIVGVSGFSTRPPEVRS